MVADGHGGGRLGAQARAAGVSAVGDPRHFATFSQPGEDDVDPGDLGVGDQAVKAMSPNGRLVVSGAAVVDVEARTVRCLSGLPAQKSVKFHAVTDDGLVFGATDGGRDERRSFTVKEGSKPDVDTRETAVPKAVTAEWAVFETWEKQTLVFSRT